MTTSTCLPVSVSTELLRHTRRNRHLDIAVYRSREAMGAAAAELVQATVARWVARMGTCRVIFACAPSQDDLFAALRPRAAATPEVWRAVEVFHMDEYVGLDAHAPQSFRRYLREHFLDAVEVGAFHPIRGEATDPSAEARRYGDLLRAAPVHVICLGFGENGHIAFNDPHVADFNARTALTLVDLDEACRRQQVNDGCFATCAQVPRRAMTITLPVFTEAALLCGVVPSKRKARAVRDALLGPIGTHCPATLLRRHPGAHLFLDRDAASLLPDGWDAAPAAGD